MTQIGEELLTNAKAAALASATEKGEIEKNSLHGRDLLSLLVKANMATDIPESQKLSDKDVIARTCRQLHTIHSDRRQQRCLHFLLRVMKRRGTCYTLMLCGG